MLSKISIQLLFELLKDLALGLLVEQLAHHLNDVSALSAKNHQHHHEKQSSNDLKRQQ